MENAEISTVGKTPGPIGDGGIELELVGHLTGALFRSPDGIYSIKGRVIPVGHYAGGGIDNGKPISGVHNAPDNGVGLLGAVIGVHVPE